MKTAGTHSMLANMNDAPLEIRLTQTVTEEDRQTLFGWGDDIFRARGIRFHCRKSDVHYLGTVDGHLVSHAGMVQVEVRVAGRPMMVGGIGGVVTVGTAQRKGYARRMLQQALAYMGETWQVEFGMLFCLPHVLPFYAGLGWQQIASPISIEQPEGRVPSPLAAMVMPREHGRRWPAGPVETDLPW
jgi:GNAT superfamily N-acetyltransferase